MKKILVAGAGKIGAPVACMLADSKCYQVHLADVNFNGLDIQKVLSLKNPNIITVALDVTDCSSLCAYLDKASIDGVISCLPHFVNLSLIMAACETNCHYFDLTEDLETAAAVKKAAKGANSAFVSQCGLAPGMIGIIANDIIKQFDEVETGKLRVGALPQNTSNALHYALTWSTDGLINEYSNKCQAIVEGQLLTTQPLLDLESVILDGISYEGFNTSGGLGNLANLFKGKINNLNYKTLRYPGHCQKMKVLMQDLKLSDDRQVLKSILERAVPKTYQDLVLLYISITGQKNNTFLETSYVKKIYPQTIAGIEWSAIQVSTASGVCAVIENIFSKEKKPTGFIEQETLNKDNILNNQFGKYYK